MKRNIGLTLASIAALVVCVYHSKENGSVVESALAQRPITPVNVNPLREAYFGDLHLHTSYSFDAYVNGNVAIGPDEAYRFAKGEVVTYLGQPLRRREPLDFLAVTDHAENIGVLNALDDPNSKVSQSELGNMVKVIHVSRTSPDGHWDYSVAKVAELSGRLNDLWRDYFLGIKNNIPSNLKPESTTAWTQEINLANRNYEPGKFTTFIAYEWTSMPNGANLHRNVIFKGNTAPNPFTSFDSKYPEDLWDWLEKIRTKGYEALAIPHNGNASNGLMYDWVASSNWIGRAYAEERQANEPLSEISQSKGTSETNPLLSPSDEFANYEIYDQYAGLRHHEGRPQGSYLRDALSRGLILQRKLGVNPYKYGFVGGSDFHSGLSVSAQTDYDGNNSKPNLGGGRPSKSEAASFLGESDKLRTTSGNLTGVWAESNTRESIYNALRRRETFATSGTKLKFRFFGGWNFADRFLKDKNWIALAYARGVPMGGDLPPKPTEVKAPTFVIWAAKDPNSGNLDRVQVVKLWEEDSQQKEKVFDVAWAGHRKQDPKTGRLPAIGNTVDITTGQYTNSLGSVELQTIWKDPEFDPRRFAAYYIRVLEVPTPRWSTLLAIENGLPLPKDVPATEQQRGWSSSIWYTPQAQSEPN
jgi:hypothetical protein